MSDEYHVCHAYMIPKYAERAFLLLEDEIRSYYCGEDLSVIILSGNKSDCRNNIDKLINIGGVIRYLIKDSSGMVIEEELFI